jgi:hypothetical protein
MNEPTRFKMTPLRLAGMFHSHYERLAPEFGHETRLETRTPSTAN